jgi:hypothetical protein
VTNIITTNPGAATWALSPCVALNPNLAYTFGAKTMIPSGQPTVQRVQVDLITYADDQCASTSTGYVIASRFFAAPGGWSTMTIEGGSGFNPYPHARSARMQLILENQPDGPVRALIDDLYIVPTN